MDKRREKPGGLFWLIVATIVLPLLYVASSGPARMIALRSYVVSVPSFAPPSSAPGTPMGLDVDLVQTVDSWWITVYAPLDGAAEHAWGEPLHWYWDLFPIRER